MCVCMYTCDILIGSEKSPPADDDDDDDSAGGVGRSFFEGGGPNFADVCLTSSVWRRGGF